MAEAPRLISAWTTPLSKFVTPPVGIGMGVWFATRWLRDVPMTQAETIALLTFMFAALFWFAWSSANIKAVSLGDDALHVSNYRREITVPLRDVVRVHQDWFGMRAVNIDLANDTQFGRRIVFLPGWTFWLAPRWRWQPHPIVNELREAVTAAKRADLAAFMATEQR